MSGFLSRNNGPLNHDGYRSGSTKILLLLDREPNCDHLAEWLSPEYDILLPEDGSPEELMFDLCLLDEPMLRTHYDVLQTVKQRANPVILPFLLVTTSKENYSPDSKVWDLVDDVIVVPTQKQTLETRLTNLLDRHELSLELATELDQQRNLFRKVFDSSNDAILLVNAENEQIRECNPQACEMLGYTRDELCSLAAKDIHPNELPAFRMFLESVRESGHGWTEELTCQTKDGDSLTAEISASAIEFDDQPYVVASVRDITVRHEQRQVLDSLHDVTVELMAAPTAQDIAEVTVAAAERVFEYDIAGVRLLNENTTPETLDLVAATDETYDLLSPEPASYQVGERCIGEAFEAQEPIIIADLDSEATPVDYGSIHSAICLPLGSHGVLSIGAPEPGAFDDEDLELTNILATNATAALTRAQREQALSEQTEYISGLFENTTDAIANVEFEDGTPCIRDVNPAFEQVFGYDSADIRGESLTKLVVPSSEETRSQSLVDRALAGKRIETEGRRETATGRRDFLIRVAPIQQDGENLGAYIVYTDISEQKRRDQQIQVLNRVLRHNLRNKLNVVRGVVERSLDDEMHVPDTLAKTGLDAVDALLDLSDTARSLSKGSRLDHTLEPIPIVHTVKESVASLEEEYPNANISTAIETDEWIAGTVQLDRALHELCENAIEHSDQPTPSVTITAEPAEAENDWVAVSVGDDGPGIPEDQQAVLRNGEETQLQHGNGLGLWVVHWIVTIAGGDLTLSDDDDRGTTVTLRLPTVGHRHQSQEGQSVSQSYD